MEDKNLEMDEEKVYNSLGEEASIVDFTDESGHILKFYHIDTIEYDSRMFAFFLPAEEMEQVASDEVIIYEISGEEGKEELIPITDQDLLDAVYNEFVNLNYGEDDCDCGECHDDDCHDDGCDCHTCHGYKHDDLD